MRISYLKNRKICLSSIIVTLIFVLINCSNEANMQSKNDEKVNSPTISGEAENEPVDNSNQTNLSENGVDLFKITKEESDIGLKQINKEIQNEVLRISDAAGLSKLDKEKTLPQDKEVRFWTVDEGLPLKGFVYKLRDKKSFAFEIYSIGTKSKVINNRLDEPKSGWVNWLEYLSNQDIILKKSNEARRSDPDVGFFVIESKINQNYVINIFSQSKSIEGNENLINLCKKIQEEFEIIFPC